VMFQKQARALSQWLATLEVGNLKSSEQLRRKLMLEIRKDLDKARDLNDAFAKLLIDRDKLVSPSSTEDLYALMAACGLGFDDVAKHLLEGGLVEANQAKPSGWSGLMEACQQGQLGCVRTLLDHGASVNRTKRDGWSPLMISCKHGFDDCARLVLDRGANASAAKADGWTPIMICSSNGHPACVQLLLDYGADVRATRENGFSALMASCQNGHAECAQLLIDKGAVEVDSCRFDDGWTALMLTCQNGHRPCAEFLLSRSANVNYTKQTGWTALMAAAQSGHVDVAALLLDSGADPRVVRSDGPTALSLATERGRVDVTKLLREYLTPEELEEAAQPRPRSTAAVQRLRGASRVVDTSSRGGGFTKYPPPRAASAGSTMGSTKPKVALWPP